jgi:cbb3-type cytochrome oxidase subunit 3
MKKFAPLIILAIFMIGVIWMIFGMKNAMNITDHTKIDKTTPISK